MSQKQCKETKKFCDDPAMRNGSSDNEPVKSKYVRKIVWKNVIIFSYINLAALYGILLIITSARIYTTIWGI